MMNIFKLAYKNIVSRPLNLLLSTILFGLGIGLINFLLLFNSQLKEKFYNNLADIDLVIGAKGSPLQLILNGMYHIDNPTGNIKVSEAKAFLNPKHPLVKKAVPLSLGDNYRSFRIVGTTYEILDLYKAELKEGILWDKEYEVVVGAAAAEKTGLKLGDTFTSSHGFADDDDMAHEHAALKVVGILKGTGSVIDQLILTTTSSVWSVHDHDHGPVEESGEEDHDHEEDHEHDHDHDHKHKGCTHASHKHDDKHKGCSHGSHKHDHDHAEHDHDHKHKGCSHASHKHDDKHKGCSHGSHKHDHDHVSKYTTKTNSDILNYPDQEITTLLLQYKSKTNYQALNLKRNIDDNTDMQAASPAIEISRLYSMIGIGTDMLQWLAILIAIVSAISIFINLYKSMKERKYELSIMRVLGSNRSKVFSLIVLEGIIMAFIGFVVGFVLSHVGLEIASKYLSSTYRYSFSGMKLLMPQEFYLLIVSLFIGFLAAIIPAMRASNTDINKTLTDKE